MAKTRTKAATIVDVSPAEAQAALNSYAANQSKLKGIEAKMETEIQKIREKYADNIKQLQTVSEDDFRKVQFYAERHKKDLFALRKSADWGAAIIGLRTATPSLKIGVKGRTWEDILAELPPDYIRTKTEPMKDKILADRETLAEQGLLTEWGLIIEQRETFFVELKEEILTK